ncbi:dihydrodipicolinate synthase family protein [Micromonospora sp. M12]
MPCASTGIPGPLRRRAGRRGEGDGAGRTVRLRGGARVGGYGSRQARRWTEQAAEAGAHGVLARPPDGPAARDADVVAHYREVAAVGLPVVAHNEPYDTRLDLTPDLLATVAEIDGIVAVKEVTGDVRRLHRLRDLCPHVDVLVGADDVVLELVLCGATGWVATLPNALPRQAVRLYELCVARDLGRALPLYAELHPILGWASQPEAVQAVKLAMECAGRFGGRCRPPRGPCPGPPPTGCAGTCCGPSRQRPNRLPGPPLADPPVGAAPSGVGSRRPTCRHLHGDRHRPALLDSLRGLLTGVPRRPHPGRQHRVFLRREVVPCTLLPPSSPAEAGRAGRSRGDHARGDRGGAGRRGPGQPAGGTAPFQVLDPQAWQNPDTMTWNDFKAVPGKTWADPSVSGSVRNFKIALVALDYPDETFAVSQRARSTVFGNPSPSRPTFPGPTCRSSTRTS